MIEPTSQAKTEIITVSAPGRIILGGEHQDIFHLPVISAGINLRLYIKGQVINKPAMILQIENMRKTVTLPLRFPIKYRFRRSYLQSGLNNLFRAGYEIPGFQAKITSQIPQNAGLSSSSALCVAWAQFLFYIVRDQLKENMDRITIADWAHKFEVTEFNEPGGKHDHIATALGGVNYFEFPLDQPVKIEPLEIDSSKVSIVIGHSRIRKNTLKTVFRIRKQVARALNDIFGSPKLDYLKQLQVEDIPVKKKEFQILKGILEIRDLTQEMKHAIVEKKSLDVLGSLIKRQHRVLQKDLHLSISRIDDMIKNAEKAGAYGAKINGSGEGGCMYAICDPDDSEKIAQAIQQAQGTPYIVSIDDGVKLEVKDEF